MKINLNYIGKDGKPTVKDFTIKMGQLKDDSNHYFGGVELKWKMFFSLVLPDHYVEVLRGKSVPSKQSNHATTNYPLDFKKTINSETISGLCDQFNKIHDHYRWCIDMVKRDLKKVLFFTSKSDFNSKMVSTYDSTKIGSSFKMDFIFAVGYVDVTNLRYNSDKLIFQKNNYNSLIYDMKYVIYTEERHDFFKNMMDNFKKMDENITNFTQNLTEEGFDLVVNNPTKLIGI